MTTKIAFIDETANRGGAEINVLLITSLLQLQGYEPIVVVPKWGPLIQELQKKRVEYQIISGCPSLSVSFYIKSKYKIPNPIAWIINLVVGLVWVIRLANFLSTSQCKLVHTNSMIAHIFGGMAARLVNIPVVWHFQDIIAHDSGFGIYRKVLLALSIFLPDRILAISDQVLEQFLSKPAVLKKAILFQNTIDTNKFCPTNHGNGHTPNILRIATVARLTPWKGQDIALSVAHKLSEEGIRFLWHIVGTSELGEESYANHLKQFVNTQHLNECVLFTGWVEDMPSFYRSIDLLVHIPVEVEPYGLTIAEAMSCGVPVVATPGGAANQLVESGGGWIVPPRSISEVVSIIKQLSPKDLVERGALARRYAKLNYSVEHYMNRLIDIYAQL